ncbi:hypothetical protein EJB05_24055, partial [Eragrostis curvula]
MEKEGEEDDPVLVGGGGRGVARASHDVWAEAAWFRHSAATPDFCLYYPNIVVLLLVYTVAPLPLALLELRAPPKATSPYKLQPRVRLSQAAFFRCYKDTARVLLLTVGVLQFVSYPAVKMVVGIRTGLPLPSLGETAAQLVVYFLVDYVGYWIHRLLHTEWGYDKIHCVHHEYAAPVGFAAPYAHWAEVIAQGFPAFVGPAIDRAVPHDHLMALVRHPPTRSHRHAQRGGGGGGGFTDMEDHKPFVSFLQGYRYHKASLAKVVVAALQFYANKNFWNYYTS